MRVKSEMNTSSTTVSLPPRPEFPLPDLPVHLSSLGDDALMELFVQFTLYANYAAGRLTRAEVKESEAEHALEVARASYMVGTWTGESTERVTISKAQALVDPAVEKAWDLYQQARAHRKLLGVVAASCERNAQVVSRELTRRVGRQEVHERRVGKWTP